MDAVKGKKSPLTGDPVIVVAAGKTLVYTRPDQSKQVLLLGGIYDGRGLAAALS